MWDYLDSLNDVIVNFMKLMALIQETVSIINVIIYTRYEFSAQEKIKLNRRKNKAKN